MKAISIFATLSLLLHLLSDAHAACVFDSDEPGLVLLSSPLPSPYGLFPAKIPSENIARDPTQPFPKSAMLSRAVRYATKDITLRGQADII